MPSHDSLFLLRNVLAATRLVYLLRTAPCCDSPELPMYDAVLRDSLSATLNVDIDDNRWTQASLPVRCGGLGVRGITLLAPSAYLASAASTMELTSALLPMRLRIIEDSGIASAMSTWTRLATSSKDMTFTPSPPSKLQRVWDDQCCKIQVETLLDVATDHVVRARRLAACSPGSSDWLDALSLSSVGLHEIGQCNDPYCCWTSPRCTNCAATRVCLWFHRHCGWASRPVLSPRLWPTCEAQSSQ